MYQLTDLESWPLARIFHLQDDLQGDLVEL